MESKPAGSEDMLPHPKEIARSIGNEVLDLEGRQYKDDELPKSKRMSATRRALLDAQVKAWTEALAIALGERGWPNEVSAYLNGLSESAGYVHPDATRRAIRVRLYGEGQ